MKQIIMCYVGEMALKGMNKSTFEAQLTKSIRNRIRPCGNFKIYKAQSTFYIEPEDEDADTEGAFERAEKVFGIASISKAVRCEKDMDRIEDTAKRYLGDRLCSVRTFKVTAKRSDKTFYMDSPRICSELGARLLSDYPNLRVNVKSPDLKVVVEIRDYAAYVHSEKEPGAGGMPTGSSGKGAAMLSGGIDSPVAVYMMAKRGMEIAAVHFASPPYTGERARQKVISIAEKLSLYTGRIELFIVPFTKTQEYIRDYGQEDLFTVLMRRSMIRITEKIARQNGAGALITGESLGQVASQTLHAITATNRRAGMPVFRPLIGMDKTEITEIARKIDTFETSILPYEDCCTIFTPPHPRTRPKLVQVLQAEKDMGEENLFTLENEAAEKAEKLIIQS